MTSPEPVSPVIEIEPICPGEEKTISAEPNSTWTIGLL